MKLDLWFRFPKSSVHWIGVVRLMLGIGLMGASYFALANSHNATRSHGHMAHTAESVVKGPANIHQATSVTASFDGQGRLWAVWIFGQALYVNYSDDLGKSYSEPVKVNQQAENISSNSEARPNIVVANNGNVYVSYAQNLEKRFSGNVRFSRSIDGGKRFSAPITVNDNREMIGHSFPVLAVNQQGDVYMVWLDSRDKVADQRINTRAEGFIGSSVYYALSDDEGLSFQSNVKIQDHSCQCCRIAITLDPHDLPVILWRHVYGADNRDHGMVRFVSKSKLAAPMRVTDDGWRINACPHHGPSLSIDKLDNYHMVWFTQGESRKGSFYAHSTNQGASFSEPVKLGDGSLPAQHPHVLAIEKNVYVVWKSFDGNETTLYVMRSLDRGRSWGRPTVIAKTANASDHGFLLAKDQDAFVSWHTVDQGQRLLKLDPVMFDDGTAVSTLSRGNY
ncbi:MAG: hypothetical protein COB51_01820 [Moraxellaceae bacterium]|nr:MAG: hypothetical protein COB51_01820 [Moraxellaceae bacterium]